MATAAKNLDNKIMGYLHYLNTNEKKAVLTVVKTLVKESNHENDFWDELSKEQQDTIDKAIKEADEGRLTPHKDVMKKLRKWAK